MVGAARKVRDKLLRIAAHRLEVATADLELAEGRILGLLVDHVNAALPGDAVARRRLAHAASEIAALRALFLRALDLDPANARARECVAAIERLQKELKA